MDAGRGRAAKFYVGMVERIRAENGALVDGVLSQKPGVARRPRQIARGRSIIPLIRPSPRASFLSITPINLFTRDDPVLRYVPGIKTTGPAAITWYEDTVIGGRPMNTDDAIGLFLRSSHRDSTRDAAQTLESLFCPVCCLFGCGIHGPATHSVLRFDEDPGCVCDSTERLPQSTGGGGNISKESGLEYKRRMLRGSPLKRCVIRGSCS